MMLWWKYQQLRSSNLNTRLATIAELAAAKNADSVGPLLFALKDATKEIRSAAALALGQFQDKQVVGPLINMLADPTPLARATAAEALGQLQNPDAITPLIPLLCDADATVRARASHSLERLGWQPETDKERTWHIVATGNLNKVAELGSDGVEVLAEMMRNGPPEKQLSAAKALAEIEDPRVPKLMVEALKKPNVLMRLAAVTVGRLRHVNSPWATQATSEPRLCHAPCGRNSNAPPAEAGGGLAPSAVTIGGGLPLYRFPCCATLTPKPGG